MKYLIKIPSLRLETKANEKIIEEWYGVKGYIMFLQWIGIKDFKIIIMED